MKQIFSYTLLIAFGILMSNLNLNAQESNSRLIFEKINSKFSGEKFEDGAYKINEASKHKFEAADPELLKKLKLEGQIINAVLGTFLLEFWGVCYIFQPNTNDCSDCILIWYDHNNDNLVQPRKEIRAVCERSLKACGLNVRKMSKCQ